MNCFVSGWGKGPHLVDYIFTLFYCMNSERVELPERRLETFVNCIHVQGSLVNINCFRLLKWRLWHTGQAYFWRTTQSGRRAFQRCWIRSKLLHQKFGTKPEISSTVNEHYKRIRKTYKGGISVPYEFLIKKRIHYSNIGCRLQAGNGKPSFFLPAELQDIRNIRYAQQQKMKPLRN